ncbi:MAG: hypothetical protein GY807_08180 [Gammaproteobacteria bacterium]|nr:hypothetical protein [Gammaproteobacteria bacterium]
MAKIFVSKSTGEQVPFLRGILEQSLVSAGLSFQDAYGVAQVVRDDLENVAEITSIDLIDRVAKLLGKRFGGKVRHAYETGAKRKQDIIVRSSVGEAPFSLDILTRSLQACVVDKVEAQEAGRRVHEMLQKSGYKEIDPITLQGTIYRCLKDYCSIDTANRYLSWQKFEKTGDPLILLVGGATGTGKSTITTELAYRLDVVRTQSTDMMRQIIRSYLAPHVVPTLAFSSFQAWRGIPAVRAALSEGGMDNPVVAGFMEQFAVIKVALEATIARAVQERQDLIVDGIHVLPSELDLADAKQKALVVPIMLVVSTKNRLVRQLVKRSRDQPEREASRYLRHLDDIWDLQSYQMKLADKADIPIIANWSVEDTVGVILNQVSARVSQRYPANPSALG